MRQDFKPARLGLALLLGVFAQLILLAFGLHGSLLIARLSFNSNAVYWMLNGAYLTIGMSVALLVIPWMKLAIRSVVAAGVLMVGIAVGFVAFLR